MAICALSSANSPYTTNSKASTIPPISPSRYGNRLHRREPYSSGVSLNRCGRPLWRPHFRKAW